jgi:N-methylhydantoinase A
MKKRSNHAARLAVDIGGTFTDIFMIDSRGRQFGKKILSTPDDYSRAVAEGVADLLTETGVRPDELGEVLHGTTVVTNTCIELTGAKVGLITTKGFRDVLEISRGRMPRLYDLAWTKPTPLAPRYLRLEVDERVNKYGTIERPLDLNEVEAVVHRLLEEKVESIAVCLYNAPLNPIHENQIAEVARSLAPTIYLSLSTRVMPLLKEYERTCETVVNAYVMPVLAAYMLHLKDRLRDLGIRAPLFIMQSNGGMITAEESAERPVEIVECGPAGGVVGGATIAKNLGIDNLITLDLGGTTCKASIVEDGRYTHSWEYEVGAGIHMSSRLRKGNGYVLRVPSIDIAEIGAGGGSIVWVDSGGLLNVGPRSAGADPGPACYGRGGEDPCLTDCYLVLGYLNPNHLLGGDFRLDAARAHGALEKIGRRLNMRPEEVAYGAYRIANSNMTRAITAVSSERGRDPRKFVLLVFGGAGALHVAQVAQGLGVRKAIVAPYAGVFSAFGFACADIERNRLQGFIHPWDEGAISHLGTLFSKMIEETYHASQGHGQGKAPILVERFVDLRYKRQASELTIPVPPGEVTPSVQEAMRRAFDQEHEKTFGHSFPRAPVEMASVRVVGRTPLSKPILAGLHERRRQEALKPTSRQAYFLDKHGFVETPVIGMTALKERPIRGPVLIDKYDTTIVVPPRCRIALSAGGSLMMTIA